jgi:ketosteroid isomerase-like protein
MSAENVELLREIYDRWGTGDFRPHPSLGQDFTITMGPDFPDSGVHAGLEGVAAYMRGFLEPWERVTIAAEEMTDSGDLVLVRVHQSGTGQSSGIAVEMHYFQLWSFSGTRPLAMETIMHKAEAIPRIDRG